MAGSTPALSRTTSEQTRPALNTMINSTHTTPHGSSLACSWLALTLRQWSLTPTQQPASISSQEMSLTSRTPHQPWSSVAAQSAAPPNGLTPSTLSARVTQLARPSRAASPSRGHRHVRTERRRRRPTLPISSGSPESASSFALTSTESRECRLGRATGIMRSSLMGSLRPTSVWSTRTVAFLNLATFAACSRYARCSCSTGGPTPSWSIARAASAGASSWPAAGPSAAWTSGAPPCWAGCASSDPGPSPRGCRSSSSHS
mmetsp:Transcript_73590/g.203170  ORF Transcript_73590/g.203170 Transcript_73590/m.203170 type:complete len:260 (+) Transcript_73590:366-1145(+)